MEVIVNAKTQAQADRLQMLFQSHKTDNVIRKIETFPCDDAKDAIAVIFTFDNGDEFHYKLDANGETITAGFFGGGAESWFN